MLITGNWADILDVSFRRIFDQAYANYPEQYSTVFSLDTSDRNYEKFSTSTGFAMANNVSEGEEIPVDDPVQGFDSTFTHKKVALAFIVSSELMEDDQFKVIAAKPAQTARAVKNRVETDAADILINSDSTINNTGPDGVSLSSASHPREDGGAVQSNRATTALTEASLETALVAIAGLLDGKGQKIMIHPDLMIVPPSLEVEARVLLESIGRTQTTYLNDINPFQNRMEVFTYNWLTDTTDWFMVDRKLAHLKFFWRRKATLKRDDNVSNDVARWYTTARYSYGWTDWRGVYCNIVAGS